MFLLSSVRQKSNLVCTHSVPLSYISVTAEQRLPFSFFYRSIYLEQGSPENFNFNVTCVVLSVTFILRSSYSPLWSLSL